ncbi:imelysin family protein [Saxibacter everestensis]|uniref:Imelysin family protein n=1 Tax=Saxibacter everestensis TaxID=2909229 RepID=A0ABY8QX81_9MICO|nr:imelysin family protein [Brevibacteriaceae bacterium ZFBP1038]
MRHLKYPVAAAALTVFALSGCTAKVPASSDAAAKAITVTSTDQDCAVSAAEAPSGTATFRITNKTDRVTEFYVLAEDKLRIVGEKENILAGTTTDFTISVQPGDYFTSCKPGMVGEGVGMAAFKVTDSGAEANPGSDDEQVQAAVDNYVAYVKDQVAELVTGTEEFAKAYRAGDDDKARDLYASTRASYERIEPTAESFGDLDPKLDFREPMAKEEGIDWTGWHRIEKDLWAPEGFQGSSDQERDRLAELLVSDTKDLYKAVYADEFSAGLDIGAISNGAIGLLDEVASSKITGEEEEFSHTDLSDVKANVEGASVAYGNVRDLAASKGDEGKALVSKIDGQFKAMDELLAKYGDPEKGFTSYDKLSKDEIKELSDQVNALSEPLSQLTSAVLGIQADS